MGVRTRELAQLRLLFCPGDRRPHANRLSKLSVLRKHQKSSLVVFESLNWNVYYRLYKHLFKAFPFPGTVVLSPDLMIATMELWKKLASKFPKYAYSCSAIKRWGSCRITGWCTLSFPL